MNVNKKLILLLCFLLLIPMSMGAKKVSYKDAIYINGTMYCKMKYIDKKLVFCTQFEANAPSSCESTKKLDMRQLAGIGSIISWYDSNSSDSKYVCTEKLITKFMYNYVDKKNRNDYDLSSHFYWIDSCGGPSAMQSVYSDAQKAYKMVDDLNKDVITYRESNKNVSSLSFSASGNNYVASVNVRTKSSGSKSFDDKYPIECEVTTKNASVTVSKKDKYYTATVTADKSKSGQEIKIRCRAKYTFKAPKELYTNCDGQELIRHEKENTTKNGKWKSISGKFNVPSNPTPTPTPSQPKTYTATVYKKDESGALLKEATFGFYDKNCSNLKFTITTKNGVGTKSGLTDTYCVKEIKSPAGYEKSNESKIISSTSTSVTFINTKTCQSEFDNKKVNNVVSMTDRIELYDKYKYKNLLNMSNNTSSTACSNYTPSYNKNTGCLTSNINDGLVFNSNNISNYNELMTINDNGKTIIGYCLSSLKFINKLDNTSGNYSTYAGMLLLKGDIATQSNLTNMCYWFIKNNTGQYSNYTGNTILSEKLYSNYVSDVSIEDKSLTVSDQNLLFVAQSDGSYTSNIQKNYYLPLIYSKNGSGDILENNCSTCKYIGNGLISNLNSSVNSKKLKFSYNSSFFGQQSGTCTYSVIPRLIKNNELQLEFRTIDTVNPFAGKNGKIRNTGSNWCSEKSCSGNPSINNTISTYITSANNSYNTTGQGAKYVIELTSSNIKEIRNYNKSNEYDNYDFTCKNNGIDCISNYLTTLKNKGIVKTIINEKRLKFE